MGNKLLANQDRRITEISLPDAGLARGVTSVPSGEVYLSYGHGIVVVDFLVNQVVNFAGKKDETGSIDGHALTEARFYQPAGLLGLTSGAVIVCDQGNLKLRRIYKTQVETFAGCGLYGLLDGPVAMAKFSKPTDLTLVGDSIFVADWRYVRIISSEGIVTTLTTKNGWIGDVETQRDTIVFSDLACICPYAATRGVYVTDPETTRLIRIDIENREVRSMTNDSRNNSPTLRDSIQREHTMEVHPELEQLQRGKSPSRLRSMISNAGAVCAMPSGTILVLDQAKRRVVALPSDSSEGCLKLFKIAPLKTQELTEAEFLQLQRDQLEGKPVPNLSPYMHFSYSGDLIWTNGGMDNKLCAILGFDPPTLSLLPTSLEDSLYSFCDLLEFPTRFASLKLTHQPSSTEFHLSPGLFQLIAPSVISADSLEKLSNATVPLESLRLFFRFLYGSTALPPSSQVPKEACLEMVRFSYLARIAKIDRTVHWLNLVEWRLATKLLALDLDSLLEITFEIIYRCEALESLIDMVCMALTLYRDKKDKIKGRLGTSPKAAIISTKLSGKSPLFVPSIPLDRFFELNLVQTVLNQEGKSLDFFDTKAFVPGSAGLRLGNFRIDIKDYPLAMFVHDWVMYIRWAFFRNLIDSNGPESQSMRLFLPRDFPPAVLRSVIQYIYTSGEFYEPMSEENYLWLLNNGHRFGFWTEDSKSAFSGFEALFDRCKIQLNQPISIETSIPFLTAQITHGSDNEIDQTISFIATNLPSILRSGKLKNMLIQFHASTNLAPERVSSIKLVDVEQGTRGRMRSGILTRAAPSTP